MAPEGLLPAPQEWPAWRVSWRVDTAIDYSCVADHLDDFTAVALLHGGGIARIDRASASTQLTLPDAPTREALVHPHLAITALVAGGWLGRRTFHAGSFVHDGGVWGVLGDRGHGKSSALAWLAHNGHQVFADDLLVLSDAVALAGPRILDLRRSAAEHFGIGRELGMVGTRDRWRIDLDDVAAEVPFRGWVTLAWSESGTSVEAVPIQDRLKLLVESRGVIIAEDSTEQWLPIIAKPMFRFARPKDWASIDAAMGVLLDAIAAAR